MTPELEGRLKAETAMRGGQIDPPSGKATLIAWGAILFLIGAAVLDRLL